MKNTILTFALLPALASSLAIAQSPQGAQPGLGGRSTQPPVEIDKTPPSRISSPRAKRGSQRADQTISRGQLSKARAHDSRGA
jgi:hypothetical protein